MTREELDKLIMNIQVHVCEWNFGGIDKTPYKDMLQYVKEKLNDGLLKEWMNYEHQNSKKDDSAPSKV